MKINYIVVSAIALFSVLATSVNAEVKSLKCTYLLENWKKNDLADCSSCPSGDAGLGKPWRWVTFTFDTEVDTKSTPVEVTYHDCLSPEISTVAGTLTITPTFLIFNYPNDFGKMQKVSINRKNLVDSAGQQCEVIKIDVSGNKI